MMSFLLISQAWGQGITLPEGVSADGKMRILCPDSYVDFAAESSSRIEVSNFGEGKIRVGIFGDSTEQYNYGHGHYRKTVPFSIHLIGVDNGFGAYDLYRADKKDFDKSIGELVLFQKSVSLNLFSDLTVTQGVAGSTARNCNLVKTGAVKFTVVTPKCFNRRGKIKKCPIIKF